MFGNAKFSLLILSFSLVGVLGELALAEINVVLNKIAVIRLRIGRMQLILLLRQTSLTKNLTLLFIIKILKTLGLPLGEI